MAEVQLNAREKVFRVLGAISVQLFLVVAAGLALFKVPQLQDMIVQTNQDADTLISFAVAIAYFSFIMWWSSRWILRRVKSPGDPENVRGTLDTTAGKWVPRLLPLLFLTLLGALAIKDEAYAVAIISIIEGLLFTLFVSLRLAWTNQLGQHKNWQWLVQRGLWNSVIALCFVIPSTLAVFFITTYVYWFEGLAIIFWGLANMVLGCVLVTYYLLAPAMNVLLRGISWLLHVTLAKTFGEQADYRRFFVMRPPYPVVSLILLSAFMVSWLLPTDNHAFRTLDSGCVYRVGQDISVCAEAETQAISPFKPYQSVQAAVAHFVSSGPKLRFKSETNDKTFVPVFIIASQGGGLRASYWSAVTLSLMAQRYPGFSSNVFAMTGASGGTVGNAAWLASLNYSNGNWAADVSGAADCDAADQSPVCLQKAFLSHDFLSPVVTSFLHNDFLYRFLPIPMFEQDRAWHLEASFERAFEQSFGEAVTICEGDKQAQASPRSVLSQGYFDYYQCNLKHNEAWRPILVGTSYLQELGAMSLTVPFNFNDADFPGSYDLQKLQSQLLLPQGKGERASTRIFDLPLITTAVNSARFPYITPAGSLNAVMPWQQKIHVQDAGYFDNFGAKSARQLLRLLDKHLPNTPDNTEVYVPMLLVLKNAPFKDNALGLVNPQSLYEGSEHEGVRAPLQIPYYESFVLNEISAPLQGLLNARGGHSAVALAELDIAYKKLIRDNQEYTEFFTSALNNQVQPLLFEFSLAPGEAHEPPVGWWLSEKSRQVLDSQIDSQVHALQDYRLFHLQQQEPAL